jgi:hypothetical protein
VNLNDSEEFLRNSTPNKKEEPKRNSQATTTDLSSEDRIPSNLSRNYKYI